MLLQAEKLSYCYAGRKEPTLKNLSLEVFAGEMLLLAGRSGCGKSTLLKAISGILTSENDGLLTGSLLLNGAPVQYLSLENIGLSVGTVYQTPEDQLFAMTVGDEVAFALENRGRPEAEIRQAVRETLAKVGLAGFEKRGIHQLSGGQKQRLALASVLVTRPQLLVLDEPVSQMNPQGVKNFMRILTELNREDGITIIVAEHRVNELSAYFSRLAVMSEGELIFDGPTERAWNAVPPDKFSGLREPETVKLARALKLSGLCSEKEQLLPLIRNECLCHSVARSGSNAHIEPEQQKDCLLAAQDLSYKYPGAKHATLQDISFNIASGEVIAVMGRNGAGKSTLLNILSGLTASFSGKVYSCREKGHYTGYLRQEPDLMLLADSVREEFYWKNKNADAVFIQDLVVRLGLAEQIEDFPLALSKGQRLRTVLGALLAKSPALLFLDEPTAGQDQESLTEIKKIIKFFTENGGSVLFCTHDLELASEIAHRVFLMENGRILTDDSPHNIFTDRRLLREGGLNEPPLLAVSEELGLPPCINVKEVLEYVDASTMGRQ